MILGTGAFKNILGNTFLIVVMLLCLCVSSWGACWSSGNSTCSGNWQEYNCLDECGCGAGQGSVTPCWSNTQDGNRLVVRSNCPSHDVYVCGEIGPTPWGTYQTGYFTSCGHATFITCNTQAEADSVACERDPSGPNCQTACTAYQNECESRGGEWQGQATSDTTCTSTCNLCNTEEAKFIEDYVYKSCCAGGMSPVYSCGYEGIPLGNTMVYGEVLQATCNSANWETNKICSDYLSSSSAQIESSVSGQSSSSEISEYCQLFPTDLVCKCEVNPDSPDCAYLSSSSGGEGSSGSGEGSSGSGEGSSGSGGGIGGGDSSGSGGGIGGGGDWEYDYRDSLHRIINATTRTANNTGEIANNTGIIKSILQQAKCLFTDCTDYGAIKDALDSNVNIPSGDTAGVLDSMARLNNLDSLGGYIDGLNWASYGDSIDGALNELGNGVDGLFTDSGLYGPMNDYRDMIEEKFPTAQWSYTSSCPAALNSTISFNFPAPIGTISTGKSLGGYFCGPLPPFNITLGNIIRAVIRLALTIAMAIGIFKAATGFNNE